MKIYILLILMLAMTSSVCLADLSVAPLIDSQHISYGVNVSLPFYVYASDGTLLTNTTTGCNLSVSDTSGKLLYSHSLSYRASDKAFYAAMDSSYLPYTGTYSYSAYCVSAGDKGHVSGIFYTSPKGVDTSNLGIAFVLFGCCFAFALLYFMQMLPAEHFFLMLISLFFAVISFVGTAYVFIGGVVNASRIMFTLPMTYLSIFVLYFGIFLIYHWFKKSERMLSIFKVRE